MRDSSRWSRWVTIAAVLMLATIAALVSYSHMYELALRHRNVSSQPGQVVEQVEVVGPPTQPLLQGLSHTLFVEGTPARVGSVALAPGLREAPTGGPVYGHAHRSSPRSGTAFRCTLDATPGH